MAKQRSNRRNESNQSNAAFIVGSVIGGVAGAAIALWKTPQTGAELRGQLTGAGNGQEHSAGSAERAPRMSSRVLGAVEKATAPLVGVKLGQTAHERDSVAATTISEEQVVPPGTSDGELTASGIGHAATTEELITPPDPATAETPDDKDEDSIAFPDLRSAARQR